MCSKLTKKKILGNGVISSMDAFIQWVAVGKKDSNVIGSITTGVEWASVSVCVCLHNKGVFF